MLRSNKIHEDFEDYIKKPFWELSEASFVLCAHTHFPFHYSLDKEIENQFSLKSYGAVPYQIGGSDISQELMQKRKALFDMLRSDVLCSGLKAYPIRVEWTIDDRESGITYLVRPLDAAMASLKNGHTLPLNLQKAFGFYQLPTTDSPSKGDINELKRLALAQYFWFQNPGESIASICRKMHEFKDSSKIDPRRIKNNHDFCFIHKSDTKNREVAKIMKPISCEDLPTIPNVFEKRNDLILFDFQKLDLAVNQIAELLIYFDEKITYEEILEHPLIKIYIETGGDNLSKIIEHFLQDAKYILS